MSERDCTGHSYEDHHFTSSDGLRLYYRSYAGPEGSLPVLCLPGLTRNSRDFHELACHLQTRHRVVTADLRGRGRSEYDPTWKSYIPEVYVRDAVELLADAGIPRVALVGMSLGGLVGMGLCATLPDCVAGLVLVDIGPELAPAGIERIRKYAGKLPAVTSWREALEQTRTVHGGALPNFRDPDWERMVRRIYRADSLGRPVLDHDVNIGRALREGSGSEPLDLWPVFDQVVQPLLVLRGALSDLLDQRILDKMIARRPDLRAVTVDDYGHAVQIVDSPEGRAAIDEFLLHLSTA